MGQSPVETKAKQGQLLEAEKSSELSASSKDCRQKLKFRVAKFPERRELQRCDPNIQQFSPDKILKLHTQCKRLNSSKKQKRAKLTKQKWATESFWQSCGAEKRSDPWLSNGTSGGLWPRKQGEVNQGLTKFHTHFATLPQTRSRLGWRALI